MDQPYTEEFYSRHQAGSRRSAEAVVPVVLGLIRPRRVVDVGCGVGTWLAAFRQHGVGEFLGVDGSYVERSLLQIPQENFREFDLRRPLALGRQFDLVVSLEVAEHLSAEYAETFVESLTGLGPVVLFSAAVPYQGGDHHVNEQWPEYWAEIFGRKGYVVVDCLRKRFWHDPNVEWWYAQNMLFFVREDRLGDYPELRAEYEKTPAPLLSIVHPEHFSGKCQQRDYYQTAYLPENLSLKTILSWLPGMTKKAVKNKAVKLLKPKRREAAGS